MKLKPIYINLGIIVIAVVLLVVFSTGTDKPSDLTNQEMPQDDIHRGMGSGMGNPSESNVSSEIKMRMEQLKKAVDENPDDTLALREYADFLSMAHKQNDAIDLYNKILKKDNKRTDIRFNIALIYYHKQDYVTAEKLIKEVFTYDKNNLQAKYNLGAIAATKGDKDIAKDYWNEVIKQSPKSQLASMAQESLKALK
jgi:tetratricopeptide (TPR) repeat protein